MPLNLLKMNPNIRDQLFKRIIALSDTMDLNAQ